MTVLSDQLRAMGFAAADVRSVVNIVDARRADALEVAIEMLTRNEEEQHNNQSLTRSVNQLMTMTDCSSDEARAALLASRGDLNAAADRLFGRSDPSAHQPVNQVSFTEQLEEQRQREMEQNEIRLEARKVAYAELLESDSLMNPSFNLSNKHSIDTSTNSQAAAQPLRFHQTLHMQRVLNDDFVLFDSEQRIRLVNQPPGFTSPAFASTPTNLSTNQSSPPNQLRVQGSPPPDFSLGLANVGAVRSVNQSVLRPTSQSSLHQLPTHPNTQPTNQSTRALAPIPQKQIPSASSLQVRLPSSFSFNSSFPTPSPRSAANQLFNMPVSPSGSPAINSVIQSSIHKPRSFSSPRKSSNPFNFALPVHHRYELTIRPVKETNQSNNQPVAHHDDEFVMTGDTLLIESFERCFLSVEADDSASINRMQPIDASMHVIVHNEQSINQYIKQATSPHVDPAMRVYAVRFGEPIYLIASNHNLITVDRCTMIANHSLNQSVTDLLPCQWRVIPARFNTQPRRIRSTGPSLNIPINQPVGSAITQSRKHWYYLRHNFRLIAMNLLKQAINEAEFMLHSTVLTSNRDARAERALCTVCLEREHDTVMMECGHLCACEECAQMLKECVVCRQIVTRRITIRN